MTIFEYALVFLAGIAAALFLFGVFKPPKVLKEAAASNVITSEPLSPLAEEMLAYIRANLYHFVLPEDRTIVAQLAYGELEKWAQGRLDDE